MPFVQMPAFDYWTLDAGPFSAPCLIRDRKQNLAG